MYLIKYFKNKPKLVISSYYDSLNISDIKLFNYLKQEYHITIIVLNDQQAQFESFFIHNNSEDRCEILKQLKCIDDVIISNDSNSSIKKTIMDMKTVPQYYMSHCVSEEDNFFYKKLNIEVIPYPTILINF